MAEIEITLPTVQYGNVKVRATPEELGLANVSEAYEVGVAAAVYLNVFTQGFKKGATLDVAAPEQSDGTDVHAEAQRLLEEGLGASEEEYDSAAEAREATQERTAGAPYDKKVDAKPKPWETGETPPPKAVVSSEW